MKRFVIFLVLTLGFTTLNFAGGWRHSKRKPDMKFEKEFVDFGTAKQGRSIVYLFKFTNHGKKPLTISDIKTSCGCAITEFDKKSFKQGESGVIKVTFNTYNLIGTQDKSITVISNGQNSPVVLKLRGKVVADNQKETADLVK